MIRVCPACGEEVFLNDHNPKALEACPACDTPLRVTHNTSRDEYFLEVNEDE